MRKLFVILITLATLDNFHAQSTLQWQQIYGGPGVEVGYSVKTCLGQGYIVAGSSSSNGPSDGHVIRTDSLGLVMWEKFYGGVNIDIIRSIKLLPDSGFVCAGYTNTGSLGGYDGWVLRLDKNGDTLWTKRLGTINWDFLYDITATFDSGFVCAGGTYGAGSGDEDMWFVKLDSVGNVVWERTWGGLKQDEANWIIETSDSLLVSCGFTMSLADTTGESWVLKLNPNNGDTLWTRTLYYHTASDKCWAISDNPATNWIYYCGERETNPGNLDAVFGILNYDGDSVVYTYTGGGNDEYYRACVTRSDGLVATFGSNHTVGGGNGDMYMFHTVNWATSFTYGTVEHDEGYSIDTTFRQGYIACGFTDGFGMAQPNTYLIKIDSAGYSNNILSVNEVNMADSTSMCFSYPNPAGDAITFHYASSVQADELILTIYDAVGQVITVNRQDWIHTTANSAEILVNTSLLDNGLYFYSVTNRAGVVITKSFVITH